MAALNMPVATCVSCVQVWGSLGWVCDMRTEHQVSPPLQVGEGWRCDHDDEEVADPVGARG